MVFLEGEALVSPSHEAACAEEDEPAINWERHELDNESNDPAKDKHWKGNDVDNKEEEPSGWAEEKSNRAIDDELKDDVEDKEAHDECIGQREDRVEDH